MVRIALIGCGAHSRAQHQPALREFAARRPGEIELAAVCDLRLDLAEKAAADCGFRRAYADIEAMLETERLDGCIAVTPIPATAAVARRIVEAGIPLLLEKPPGATLEEARALRALAEQRRAHAMVSMNRRFDPAIREALRWIGGRPIEYVRASMLRHRRNEADFIYGTALHCIDAMRSIAGDVRELDARIRRVEGTAWYAASLEFACGAIGAFDILPSCGRVEERYEIGGPNYFAVAIAGYSGAPEIAFHEQGKPVRAGRLLEDAPLCERNGAYGELVEFVESIRQARAPIPAPGDTLQSVELCHRMLAQARRTA